VIHRLGYNIDIINRSKKVINSLAGSNTIRVNLCNVVDRCSILLNVSGASRRLISAKVAIPGLRDVEWTTRIRQGVSKAKGG
jgi:hypothetical protein